MEKVIQPQEPTEKPEELAGVQEVSTQQPVASPATNPAPVVGDLAPNEVPQVATAPSPAGSTADAQKLSSKDEMPVGVAASSLGLTQPRKSPMPKGVYVIAILNLIGCIAGFISDSNGIYSLAMVFDLLVVCGLFLRLEAARITAVVVQMISVILTVLVIIMLIALQSRINQLDANYHQAVARINPATETPHQKDQIKQISAELSAKEKQVGRNIHRAYVIYGVSLVVDLGIVGYLTRPKVKQAFH